MKPQAPLIPDDALKAFTRAISAEEANIIGTPCGSPVPKGSLDRYQAERERLRLKPGSQYPGPAAHNVCASSPSEAEAD